jgi:hypothetical protein
MICAGVEVAPPLVWVEPDACVTVSACLRALTSSWKPSPRAEMKQDWLLFTGPGPCRSGIWCWLFWQPLCDWWDHKGYMSSSFNLVPIQLTLEGSITLRLATGYMPPSGQHPSTWAVWNSSRINNVWSRSEHFVWISLAVLYCVTMQDIHHKLYKQLSIYEIHETVPLCPIL